MGGGVKEKRPVCRFGGGSVTVLLKHKPQCWDFRLQMSAGMEWGRVIYPKYWYTITKVCNLIIPL